MRSIDEIINVLRSTKDGIFDLELEEIQHLIDKADATYHRIGLTSPISDEEYDLIRNQLRKTNPDDERLSRIGPKYSMIELRNKITHTIPMGSLDNTVDGILGYHKWYTDTCKVIGEDNTDIFVSLKVDGGSIRARYENGFLVVIATRGNGEVGEDITANGINFRGIPTKLSEPITCDIRGEAVLPISDFKEIVEREFGKSFEDIPIKEISNPRNIGNGIFSRDSGQDSNRISFLAFNIVCDDVDYNSEFEKMKHLKDLGLETVPHRVVSDEKGLTEFYNDIASKRDELSFEIDGLVTVVDNVNHQKKFLTDDIRSHLRPKHSRAIKFPHKSSITTLEDATISVGHTGSIIPTANLKEVRIGGVNVTHALLNNWDEIGRLDVSIGDTVEVILAGDIIPKIIRCVERSPNRKEILEPTECPSCGKPTSRELRGNHGAVTYCSDPLNCPTVLREKIDHWIGSSKKGVGIMDIGENILAALWDNNLVSDPADLYTLTVDDLKDLTLESGVRVGSSRAVKIVENIASKKNLSLPMFLGSIGIDLLGRRRVKILRDAADSKLDSLDDWLDTEKFGELKIKGLGKSIKQSVIRGIETNRKLIEKFIANGVTIDYPTATTIITEKPFDGINFCLTGSRECSDDITRLGGELKSSISKKVNYLVQKDALSTTNKTKKADEYGIRVISFDFLKQVIAGEESLDGVICNAGSGASAVKEENTILNKTKTKTNSDVADNADRLVNELF